MQKIKRQASFLRSILPCQSDLISLHKHAPRRFHMNVAVYLILKSHGQSSKSLVRLLPCKVKLSYIYTTLRKHHLHRVGPKQLCALAHLGCTREAGIS